MSNQELTPWFPADVKPARVGWYQRNWPHHEDWENDYWDGVKWHYGNPNNRTSGEAMMNRLWRGLVKKSNNPVEKPRRF